MIGRIKQLVIKEFIQTFRDRRMRFFLVVPPIMQLMMFGYVVTLDVRDIPAAVHDLDRSPESRELIRRFEASSFSIRHFPEFTREATELLDRSEVLCVIRIDRGFQEKIRKRIPIAVQVLVDGTDSNTALIAMGYAEQIIAGFGADHASPGLLSRTGSRIDLRPRAWYNPDLKSSNYNVPGVIASIVMLLCLMLTAMAIVREREAGTMEQLMVTPLRPFELMLGKSIPFALIGFVDMALITIIGVNWFGVPIRGSIVLLVLATACYILSAIGIGLFISTVSRTQQQALMATMLFYMPAILLSGFAFPIENMPPLFQFLTYLNPLRYYLVIIRGIFLKGNGFSILWPQMAALLVMGLAVIAASSIRFNKRVQ